MEKKREREREKCQIAKIKNEREDIINKLQKQKEILREYCGKL